MSFRALIIISVLAAALPVHAIVFTLKPGKGKASVHTILDPKIVMEDRVTINGQKGDMTIGVTSLQIGEAIGNLQPLMTNFKSIRNHNSVLLEAPREGKWVTRFYIISLGKEFKTLVFTMQLPAAAFDKKIEPEWPDNLPKPNADKIGPVMSFEKRGAVMANFSSRSYPEIIARQYTSSLKSAGWLPPAGQTDSTGGLFINKKAGKLMVFNVTTDAAGMTHASVFVSKITHIDSP